MTHTESTDRACVHARLIDAPREQVLAAFSQPERLARWWGPNGFRSTIETFQFRPGGKWLFTMHGPDGKDYPNESVFLEVGPERIMLEHFGHHFFLTVTLEERGSQTLLGWEQVFDTAEHRERVAEVVLEANEQNLDRLQAEVHRGA